jgi:hypothetical protein
MAPRNPAARHAANLIRHYACSSDPDQRTSMADARIALNIARGVDMDDIDPASGYSYSRDAYDRSRESWVSNIKYHGFSDEYDGPALKRAIANWTTHRPDYIAGDDWLAAGRTAHRAHWASIEHPCNTQAPCGICQPAEDDDSMATNARPGAQDSLFDDLPQPQAAVPRPHRRAITDLQLPA